MLRNARQLERFELRARDGQIGRISDLFFDDRRWTIRYLVVDTGTWLEHREVLIAASAVGTPDWTAHAVPVDLTREQVRHSPAVDTEGPVTRTQELALADYYNWPVYWGTPGFNDGFMFTPPPFLPGRIHDSAAEPDRGHSFDERHELRSIEDVRGYRIHATDGDIGHIEDFLIDEASWEIAFLVIDTRNWLPGRRVLVAPDWAYEVGWDEAKVFIDLTRDAIRHGPAYDPSVPLDAAYFDRLHHHAPLPRRSSEP